MRPGKVYRRAMKRATMGRAYTFLAPGNSLSSKDRGPHSIRSEVLRHARRRCHKSGMQFSDQLFFSPLIRGRAALAAGGGNQLRCISFLKLHPTVNVAARSYFNLIRGDLAPKGIVPLMPKGLMALNDRKSTGLNPLPLLAIPPGGNPENA